MSPKVLVILLAILLSSTAAHGFLMFRGSRCLCRSSTVQSVNPANIKKVSIFFPSGSCDKKEIIITLKSGLAQTCLNPESKQGKLILKKIIKKNS
ncbi:C-X-C motif chemokine 11 [Vombatus ursinus]|uniref:Chemokine interleukin-8-like domain-containing protein n=1 Tax=Vombatus ursinus TaxID=29139 RepID=A0A4X2KMC0_VOMUR|nr:C-X-C motif chemokine 11 [Vombatus ursinus]